MTNEKALIAERLFSRALWYLLFLIIGGTSYILGDFKVGPTLLNDPFKDAGTAVVGAVLVAILFGWIAERVVNTKLQAMIRDEFDSLLKPYLEMTKDYFIANYDWNCHLVRAPSNDILPEYFYQHVHMSFYAKLPSEIKFAGAISSDDDALKEYFQEPDVFLRWPMTIMETGLLNIQDERIFKMGDVFVNAERISRRKVKRVSTAGGDGIVYRYTVPPYSRNKVCHLQFDFIVRKKEGGDVTHVITRLYRHATNARFTLHLDKDINAREVIIYTTEATPLRENGDKWEAKGVRNVGGRILGAHAVFLYPLLPGSNIRFEIRH